MSSTLDPGGGTSVAVSFSGNVGKGGFVAARKPVRGANIITVLPKGAVRVTARSDPCSTGTDINIVATSDSRKRKSAANFDKCHDEQKFTDAPPAAPTSM